MAASIEILLCDTPQLMERFIRVPMRLNQGDPNWVPPLMQERREALSPKTNPFFRHAEAAFYLAVQNGKDVGRISAQIDALAPADPRGPAGWFGMIAGENDDAVYKALFAAAEAWLKARNCVWSLGPFNLSVNEEVGLLVDGYDTPPMVLMGHDQPYVADRIEAQGYVKAKDVFAWLYDIRIDVPAAVRRRIERTRRPGITVRHLNFKQYDKEVSDLTSIVNDAWSDNWGFTPLTEDETRHLAKSLKPLISERLIWFVDVDGETAGFIVGLPNLNEAIRDLGGKLLPFGWLKLLWRLKVTGVKSGRVPLMGVRKKYHGEFGGALLPFLLIDALRREALKGGYTTVELSWILEDNDGMNRINEALGGTKYKTYRIYERKIG
jgi:hypothetical protein